MFNYKCPKCNSIMNCLSTTSIPPIITYQCYSCGYISKPFKEEYNCEILPIELRSESEETKEESMREMTETEYRERLIRVFQATGNDNLITLEEIFGIRKQKKGEETNDNSSNNN